MVVMWQNATLLVAEQTTVKNAEGTKIKTYDFENPIETLRADVQPNTLTQEQIELYGINSKNANTKKCFFNVGVNMKNGNRVKVLFDNGEIEIYSIQPTNKWLDHSECLLIPVENE